MPVSPIAAKSFTSWLENKTEERESHHGSIVLFKSKHLVPLSPLGSTPYNTTSSQYIGDKSSSMNLWGTNHT